MTLLQRQIHEAHDALQTMHEEKQGLSSTAQCHSAMLNALEEQLASTHAMMTGLQRSLAAISAQCELSCADLCARLFALAPNCKRLSECVCSIKL